MSRAKRKLKMSEIIALLTTVNVAGSAAPAAPSLSQQTVALVLSRIAVLPATSRHDLFLRLGRLRDPRPRIADAVAVMQHLGVLPKPEPSNVRKIRRRSKS